MPTTPPSITALPAAPDPNNRTTFNALAYPWSAALPTFSAQVSAVGANVKANADEAATSATTAATQAALATTNGAAQVTLATTQAGNAAASATTATTQAGAASTQATNAAASATTASTAASTATTQAGIATTKAGEANASAIAAAASAASISSGPVTSVNTKTGVVALVKADIGLGSVDNTSDASKPVSTAAQVAINAKQDSLVSGTNIKTVGGVSLLGAGDVSVGMALAFTSAEQSITTGGLLTLAHGLGVKPTSIETYQICKTAELGYAIGDEILAPVTVSVTGARGHSVTSDATNIYIRMAGVAAWITNKSDGNATVMANANWRIIVRAFK